MIRQLNPFTPDYAAQQPLAGQPPSRDQLVAALMGAMAQGGIPQGGGGGGAAGGINPAAMAALMGQAKGKGSSVGGVAPNAMDYGSIAAGANSGNIVPGAMIY